MIVSRKFSKTIPLLVCLIAAPTSYGWQPGTGTPSATEGFTVDTNSRLDVLSFHNTIYPASGNAAANMAWTGNAATGQPGTTSVAFKNDTLRRINYYRALASVSADISFDPIKSGKCQEAALMFSVQNNLSHTPPNTWAFWTTNAYDAAYASNIAIGNSGPSAVDAYMIDSGSNNTPVGHRRWLLYPRAQFMGTGDVPANGSYNAANAIWVVGNFKSAPTPKFSPWPNAGFFPSPLLPARWSLSYPGATFSTASVSMTLNGNNLPCAVVSNNQTGIGDNTLVWECNPIQAPGAVDAVVIVTVSGISGTGIPTSHSYTVNIFNPDVLGTEITLNGVSDPVASANTTYTFSPIQGADALRMRVSKTDTSTWNEGAEDPGSMVETTAPYTLRQTNVKRSGSKAFQLAFADANDQQFTLLHDVIPTAQSELAFYDLGRFATTTSTLQAEISPDGGASWETVWSRIGVGGNSGLWNPSFIARSIPLASYAGQQVRIRFTLKRNGGSYYLGVDQNYGFFIDDITITNATRLTNPTVTEIGGTATSFTLNQTSAGTLTIGETYHLQASANVGTKWFSYGSPKVVTPRAATGYENWVIDFPGTSAPENDDDLDGLSNLVEYAFGTNPSTPTSHISVPAPTRSGNLFGYTFNQPSNRSDISYGADWSENLSQWYPIPNTGTAPQNVFQINTSGKSAMFVRHRITKTP